MKILVEIDVPPRSDNGVTENMIVDRIRYAIRTAFGWRFDVSVLPREDD